MCFLRWSLEHSQNWSGVMEGMATKKRVKKEDRDEEVGGEGQAQCLSRMILFYDSFFVAIPNPSFSCLRHSTPRSRGGPMPLANG
jgi:hypothetical protein